MLFLPCLKLNVHLYSSKFKGFLSSQHVVRDADEDDGGGFCSCVSFPESYAVRRVYGQITGGYVLIYSHEPGGFVEEVTIKLIY